MSLTHSSLTRIGLDDFGTKSICGQFFSCFFAIWAMARDKKNNSLAVQFSSYRCYGGHFLRIDW